MRPIKWLEMPLLNIARIALGWVTIYHRLVSIGWQHSLLESDF